MATVDLSKEEFVNRVADMTDNSSVMRFVGKRPAVLDFYAEWCGPCKMLSPVLEEISDEYAGKVDFYKINVDKEGELASMFRIYSIPTLVFVSMNGSLSRSQGAMGKKQLKEAIDGILLK